MVILEKAVLHILDFVGGEPVLSAQELALEDGIREFLIKHMEKTFIARMPKVVNFMKTVNLMACCRNIWRRSPVL